MRLKHQIPHNALSKLNIFRKWIVLFTEFSVIEPVGWGIRNNLHWQVAKHSTDKVTLKSHSHANFSAFYFFLFPAEWIREREKKKMKKETQREK